MIRRDRADGAADVASPIPLARPFFGMVEVTTRCQSRCAYCGCWQTPSSDNELPLQAFHSLLPQMSALGVRKLILTGGEPLLRADLEDIVRIAYACRLHTSVVTNGLALSDMRLASLQEAGLLGITLSVDTLDQDVYAALRGVTWRRMEPALALLCQRAADEGLSVSINCVLTTLNYLQVPRLVEFASERGMPVSVQPCNADSRPDWARLLPRTEDMQQVLQVILTLIRLKEQGALLLNSEKFLRRIVEFWESGCVPPVSGCYYGRANVTVQHTGDVVPCWRLPAVGNLSTDSLVDLWHAKAFQGWRREMEAGHCPGCWLACSFDWHVLWHSEGEMDRFWRKRGELPVDETRERGGGQQHGND